MHKILLFTIALALLPSILCEKKEKRQIFYPDRPMVYTESSNGRSKSGKKVNVTPMQIVSSVFPNPITETFQLATAAPSFSNFQNSFSSEDASDGTSLSQMLATNSKSISRVIDGAFSAESLYENQMRNPSSYESKYTTSSEEENELPGVPGRAGFDYPVYSEIPDTSFDCMDQMWPGYFGDVETQCQAVHICQADGRHDSFLCPNGTVFNQMYFVCDWWYSVDCSLTPSLYNLNSQLF